MLLINFIIAFVAVVLFGFFEYTQNKTAYTFQTAWFKYVIGLAAGTLLLGFIPKGEFSAKLLEFCLVVAILYFWKAILALLKIKKTP